MYCRFLTFIILWFACCPVVLSQDRPLHTLGISSQHGELIMHSPNMRHLRGTWANGLEVNLQRQTTGTKEWHHDYQFPRFGISLLWFDYNRPELGHSFALSPYLSKSIIRSKRNELHVRMGTGLAYFSRKFDPETNPDNLLISNSLNAVMQARFDYNYRLSSTLWLNTSLGLNHYSNGSIRKPNLGMNLPTVSLGLEYNPNPVFDPVPQEREPFRPSTFVDASGSVGIKRLSAEISESFVVNSVSFLAGRRITRKSNLVAGIEGFHNRSLYRVRADAQELAHLEKLPDIKRASLAAGHELLFGRLMLVTHMGLYMYRPFKKDKYYYQRIGMKYMFSKNFFGSVDLKAHLASADVIEFKLGTRLPVSNRK